MALPQHCIELVRERCCEDDGCRNTFDGKIVFHTCIGILTVQNTIPFDCCRDEVGRAIDTLQKGERWVLDGYIYTYFTVKDGMVNIMDCKKEDEPLELSIDKRMFLNILKAMVDAVDSGKYGRIRMIYDEKTAELLQV